MCTNMQFVFLFLRPERLRRTSKNYKRAALRQRHKSYLPRGTQTKCLKYRQTDKETDTDCQSNVWNVYTRHVEYISLPEGTQLYSKFDSRNSTFKDTFLSHTKSHCCTILDLRSNANDILFSHTQRPSYTSPNAEHAAPQWILDLLGLCKKHLKTELAFP